MEENIESLIDIIRDMIHLENYSSSIGEERFMERLELKENFQYTLIQVINEQVKKEINNEE